MTMTVTENKNTLGTSKTYTGDTCSLRIMFERDGKILAYLMKHKDLLFAPDLSVTAVDNDPKRVRVLLGFQNLPAPSLKDVDCIIQNMRDIQAFCKECEDIGLFQIVND